MSDPYSPYEPPSGYPPVAPNYAPQGPYPPQPAAPGMPGVVRAAAIMLGVLGGLILLFSGLIAVAALVIPPEQFQQDAALGELPPDMDIATFMKVLAGCFGICGGLLGIIFLVLTPFVWKGNRGGIITAIVFAGLVVALMVLNIITSLITAGGGAIAAVVMNGLVGAIFGVLVFLLIRSLSALREREYHAYASQQAAWQGYYGQPEQQQQPPQQQGWGHDDPNQPPQP